MEISTIQQNSPGLTKSTPIVRTFHCTYLYMAYNQLYLLQEKTALSARILNPGNQAGLEPPPSCLVTDHGLVDFPSPQSAQEYPPPHTPRLGLLFVLQFQRGGVHVPTIHLHNHASRTTLPQVNMTTLPPSFSPAHIVSLSFFVFLLSPWFILFTP